MFKKGLLFLLVLVMLFSLSGCGSDDSGTGDADFPGKIGIMSSTVTQNEEEFRAAQLMQQKYGSDKILHNTYPDRFMDEQETTITNMLELAQDPEVKVIIMNQAVPGAVAATERVLEERPDMFFILASPQEDPDIIAQKGDIVLNTDDIGRGYQIVDQAQAMGAEVFIHYSFPRHMSIEMLAQRRDLMKERAGQLGINFVEVDAPDPTGDAGLAGTQMFIMEDVPRQIAAYGPDTALFGTNCGMMEPLIRQTVDHGGIFVVQCCPSPFHAMPAALGIEVPEDKKNDVPWIIQEINNKVVEAGAGGRVATWPVPVNMMYIEAGVEYAIEWLKGDFDERVNKARLIEIMESIAGEKVTLTEYLENDNYFLYLSEHIVFQ